MENFESCDKQVKCTKFVVYHSDYDTIHRKEYTCIHVPHFEPQSSVLLE